jgi:hypothetical protein
MPISKLPVTDLDNINHRRRARETINQVLDHSFDDSRRRTDAEVAAGITPVNYAYAPGDIRRFGATSGADCTQAIQNSLNSAGIAVIPENFTAKIDEPIKMSGAGWILRGKSRYTSIIQPTNTFVGARMVWFPSAASSTCYGISVTDLRFYLHNTAVANPNLSIIGVDLSSVNNATVHRCRFEGVFSNDGTDDDDFTDYLATGVLFDAPLDAGAYSNNVDECDFTYLLRGVTFGGGANANRVTNNQILHCAFGIHLAPTSVVDCAFISGNRIEANDVGVLEGSADTIYLHNRFEDNETADIQFTADSSNVIIIGCSTASSPTPLVDFDLAVGAPIIISPDLKGIYSRCLSASYANEFLGPNVMTPLGNTGTAILPTGVSDTALYLRAGRLVLDNAQNVMGRNAAGTGGIFLIGADSSDRVRLAANGEDIRWGRPLVALGGGAAPTLGTIGGSGPATAAQNSWVRMIDSAGAACWVPAWK